MSYHISTTGMRFKNIAQVAIFTELVRKKLPVFFQKNSIIDIIANKRSFSLRMLGSPKYNEKIEEHIRVKKAICPKDGTIFDFMIRPPNNESEVVKSSLLDIPEPEVKRFPVENSDIVSETTEAEFEVVETLLKEAGIEGYSLSYPSDNFPDKFPLSRASPSQCPLCDREHTSDNAYIRRNKKSYSFFCYRANQDKQPGTRNPSLKLAINETALDREKKLQSPAKKDQSRISNPNDHFVWWDLLCMCTSGKKFSHAEVYEAIQATVTCVQETSKLWLIKCENRQNGLYFDIEAKLKLVDFKIKIIKYEDESVKLKSLIDQAVTRGLIIYKDWNFLSYLINILQLNTDFFNLFLGFLAKLVPEINKEIMNPILWHTRNIISDENMK